MSLYNHVTNKDDLIDGIVDMAIGEIDLPDVEQEWKEAMRRRANSAHEVFLSHTWATIPIVSRVNIGPAMLSYVDRTLGCLRRAGFSIETADHAWNVMDSHIYGFTLQKLNFPFDHDEYSEAATAYLSLIPGEKYPHLNELSHYVIDGHYDGVYDFGFGFELILEGLERLR
jgi:hypothetical protein